MNKKMNSNSIEHVQKQHFSLNPRTYQGGWMLPPPHTVFLRFFLEDKTSALDVFSSCSFIPPADFETSLVMVSCYDYEI